MENNFLPYFNFHHKVVMGAVAINYQKQTFFYSAFFLLLISQLVPMKSIAQSLGQGSASRHSTAVSGDGKVYTWGENDKGQLGTGDLVDRTTKYEITTVGSLNGKTVISTAAGYYHSLALTSDKTVHAWGFGFHGQLGNGNNSDSRVPVQILNLTDVIAIAAGNSHSIALKRDGTVYAWGYNFEGELGNGNNSNSNIPVQVNGLTDIIAIAAGHWHNLALKRDGTIYAWGHGGNGQLGDTYYMNRNSPVQVVGITGAIAVAAGGLHSLAIGKDKTVLAWGYGAFGQLGNGMSSNSGRPVTSLMINATAISAGEYHSFALKSDATAFTWGNGVHGELGNTSNSWSMKPILVADLTNINAISSGFKHNLALKSDGTIYGWGDGDSGQLGNGTSSDYNKPVQVVELNIGSCTNPVPQFTATVACSGTATSFTSTSTGVSQNAILEWDFNGDNIVDNNTDQNPSYTFTAAGMHTVKLTIRQGTCSATVTKDVIVEGPPAEVSITDAPTEPIAFVSGGTTITLNGIFVDDNLSAKIITWKWDENDEASNNAGILVGGSGTTTDPFRVSGSFTYNVPGVYKVTLTVKDNCGSAYTEHRYIVIYDPNGGFVTGGGWIDSPPGAYTPDINLTGKASFGFVSKYKNGSSIPVGQTEFQFRNAQLNFKSSNYEDCSLIVGGNKAKYKGTGTVEGMPGTYNFMVSVIDGQISGGVDKFRIRVWNGGGVLYDNNVNSSTQGEDSDPVTALGGGSIVIHKSTIKSTSTTSALIALGDFETVSNKFYCYPTSFSDKSVLAFSLENEENFTLDIYDMRGALVSQVKSGTAKANKLYEYELSGNGMANGMYIARLSTRTMVRSLKLVLEK
ncbi:PKD domain-containing protein [Pontibacter toksunensis]|uniref:PKD domain-containing protein n=1 Tax=Pontibacter toksunensis TaxID=1332631 RepID=A0ABW6BMN7_9BACT